MSSAPNPYNFHLPIGNSSLFASEGNDADMFFGREEALDQIKNAVRKGINTIILGSQGMGKTSLLRQIGNQEIVTFKEDEYVFFSDASTSEPPQFFNQILENVYSDLGMTYEPAAEMVEISDRFDEIERQIAKFIICIDDFEHFLNNSRIGDDFYALLKALNNGSKVTFVAASTFYAREKLADPSFPLFGFFEEIELSELDEDAARALLTKPLRSRGYTNIAQQTVDEIIRLSGGYPYLLQVAGSLMFEKLSDGLTPDIEEIAERINKERKGLGLEAIGNGVRGWKHDPPDRDHLLILAYRLVLTKKLPPDILATLDVDKINRALEAVVPEEDWAEQLRQAQELLAEESQDAHPSALWLAWMKATQGEKIDRLGQRPTLP